MFANPAGSLYYIFAPTEWGDSGTASTAFAGTDEQWFYIGNNGGSRSVGATHFPMRLLGNATGTNIFRQTRVTNVNTGARAEFDWSDVNFDEIELDSTVWVDFGVITCPAQDASKFCNGSTFINCAQMILDGFDMDGNTWNGTTDAAGAVLLSTVSTEADNQLNSTFISDGTGHAMEIALNTASLTTYNLSGLTVDGFAGASGTATDRVFNISNPLNGDVTINLTDAEALNVVGGGSGFSFNTTGGYSGTVTINTTVTLTVTVLDEAGDPVSGARVRIEESPGGTLVADGTTNASGIFTDSTYNFGGNQAVLTKVRLKGFKNFRTAGTIVSTGLSVGVTFQADTIVDLP
jgi:hypothetical protein